MVPIPYLLGVLIQMNLALALGDPLDGSGVIVQSADGTAKPIIGQRINYVNGEAILRNKDYGKPIAQWQGGSTQAGLAPAVLQPVLRDVMLFGNGKLVGQPKDDDAPDQHHGLLLNASGTVVDNLHVWGVPGTAAVFNRPGNPRKGEPLQFDRCQPYVTRLNAVRVHRGFDLQATDGSFHHINVNNYRDWGIRLSNAIHFSDVHTWGGVGPGVLITGVGNRGSKLYVENSRVGLQIAHGANRNFIDGIRAHTNWTLGILVSGTKNTLRDLEVDTETIGIEINNQYNTLDGGSISVRKEGTGIILNNTTGQTVKLRLDLDGGNIGGAAGLVANAPIERCTIDVLVLGGKVGVDLSKGIGRGNVVRVRSYKTATPVVLPASWDVSNEIVVNGKRLESGK